MSLANCESHDQALVGDKTIMFRLADKEMYWHMDNQSACSVIDRAMAFHKMIRLITCTCAGDGYLNFMGNEFGHPKWIDFPREGNGWSYSHARRRWDLSGNKALRYQFLQNFDIAMIDLVKRNNLLSEKTKLLLHDEKHKILIYQKGGYLFAYNFHPQETCSVFVLIDKHTELRLVLYSERKEFGGRYACNADGEIESTISFKTQIKIYINNRIAAIYSLDGKEKSVIIDE